MSLRGVRQLADRDDRFIGGNLQFKVPQHIEMEDKIIGPLTMKQFVNLLIGGMITYAIIKTYNPLLIAFVGVPIGLLTLAIAFIKVQDQPFPQFLLSLILFMVKPKERTWHKDWHIEGKTNTVVQKTKVVTATSEEKHIGKAELKDLSTILDTRGKTHTQQIEQINNKQVIKK